MVATQQWVHLNALLALQRNMPIIQEIANLVKLDSLCLEMALFDLVQARLLGRSPAVQPGNMLTSLAIAKRVHLDITVQELGRG